MQTSFRELAKDVSERYGAALTKVASMGVSAMMHGYLAFDKEGNQLCPFRTWRNTTTEEAARLLSEKFNFICLCAGASRILVRRCSIGGHVKDVDFITTLSGYVHWKLTGKKVISVGDASGMFPIDSETKTYHAGMMEKFDALVAGDGYSWRLGEILPEVLVAGQQAGALTEEGARFWILPESLKPALSCVRQERRGHRHGGHQQRGGAYRQCFRRHLCVRYDRAG